MFVQKINILIYNNIKGDIMWTEQLKVGDKVIVTERYCEKVETVVEITKAGNIKTKSHIFTPFGRERTSSQWFYATMSPYTQEKEKQIQDTNFKRKVVDKLRQTTYTDYTIEQLRQVAKILEIK